MFLVCWADHPAAALNRAGLAPRPQLAAGTGRNKARPAGAFHCIVSSSARRAIVPAGQNGKGNDRMGLISLLWGIVAILWMVVAFIPLLGWGNWFVIPSPRSGRSSRRSAFFSLRRQTAAAPRQGCCSMWW